MRTSIGSSHHNTVIDLVSRGYSENIRRIWGDNSHNYLIASDFRRQVWHSWLSGENGQIARLDALKFLTGAKSKDIVADRYGCCPVGYLSALRRLGTVARDPSVYQGLFTLLTANGPLRKIVHHAKRIDDDLITSLLAIPNDDFSTTITTRLLQKSADIERLSGAVWVASQLRSAFSSEKIIEAVGGSSNPIRALQRLLVQMPFPPAPLNVDPPLFAIKTCDEIRALARSFRNCLRDRDYLSEIVIGIQAGQRHLFRWEGDEPALILVEKFASIGWVIEQARGVNNNGLSEKTRSLIEQSFGASPSLYRAQASQMMAPSNGWFFK